MPLYSFECNQCEAVYDAFVGSVADEDSKRCPKCLSVDIRKLMGTIAAITFANGDKPWNRQYQDQWKDAFFTPAHEGAESDAQMVASGRAVTGDMDGTRQLLDSAGYDTSKMA